MTGGPLEDGPVRDRDEWGEFSWGPDTRPVRIIGGVRRATPPRVLQTLALVIVVLLLIGTAGVITHHDHTRRHRSTAIRPSLMPTTTLPTTTLPTIVTPPGSVPVLDIADHVTLALPAGWQSDNVSTDSLARDFGSLLTADRSMTPLLDEAADSLAKIPFHVFAVDATSDALLYMYGAPAPSGITGATQISTSAVVKEVEAVGGKDVRTAQTHLAVGETVRVALELVVKTATVFEALDYFVLADRLVYIVVESGVSATAAGVLNLIEPTLAAG